jgi:hypothetical protein
MTIPHNVTLPTLLRPPEELVQEKIGLTLWAQKKPNLTNVRSGKQKKPAQCGLEDTRGGLIYLPITQKIMPNVIPQGVQR